MKNFIFRNLKKFNIELLGHGDDHKTCEKENSDFRVFCFWKNMLTLYPSTGIIQTSSNNDNFLNYEHNINKKFIFPCKMSHHPNLSNTPL